MKRTGPLSFEKKKRIMAMLFITPWFLGFLFFFVTPLFTSLRFSFSELNMTSSGYELNGIGFKNYTFALGVHQDFNRLLTEASIDMIINVPLIIVFSLFLATILNQKFRGRAAARAVFFLPVILASGVMTSIEDASFMSELMAGSKNAGSMQLLQSLNLENMMLESGFPPTFVEYLTGAVDRIYSIISKSGVQILIFLAGLQSIPSSLYEASKMEGATGYETFWKITFPMVSSLIPIIVVYSIIDSFIDNKVTTLIHNIAFSNIDFGISSAMSWIYFLMVAVILAVSMALVSKRVFYNN
ncbi:carbohydrate ABC transporter permease [Paenibacillus sp. Dod16]|uniref:carbohydrate ABC transporter permease n=1 Tax=Paenibacillus sp. Dod16 TaxID=3416392 RepID=UPI003CF7AA5D